MITTKGVSRFDADTKEMIVDSVPPRVVGEEILENTGSGLRVAPDMEKTKPPVRSELRIIRKYDADGFWTRGHLSLPFG